MKLAHRVLVLTFGLAVAVSMSAAAQQTELVNNVKKEFLPDLSKSSAKAISRDGLNYQYIIDQTLLLGIGLTPYDNNILLVKVRVQNGSSDPLRIDPTMIRCSGTTEKGESVSVPVLDPIKLKSDRMAGIQAIAALNPSSVAGPTALVQTPNWYTYHEQAQQAVPVGDLFPGEDLSGLVFLKQPYGPVTQVKRGPNTINIQTEIYFKDLTVVVPVAGKEYSFSFTVNYSKK